MIKNHNNKLIVLGSVNADHVLQVPSFPRPGETLVGSNYQVIAGGKGANQALAAAKLNANIGFIACVGDDAFGLKIRDDFQSQGIDISGVNVIPNCPTGIAIIQVSAQGENSICLSSEANAKLTAQCIEPYLDKIRQAQYLLMQLETPLEGIILAARAAKQSATQVILNPAPAQNLPDSLLQLVDIITPNETEAQILTKVHVCDESSAKKAADILHDKGIAMVLITLGAKGVYFSQNKQGKIIAGFKVDVVDTTAAGDTFNAAFVTGLMEDMPLDYAIYFAHAAAAISITRFGAQPSLPNRDEVMRFLEQNKR